MKLFLIASLSVFGLKAVNAFNPYITSTDLRGCNKLNVGSSYTAYSDFIDINDLENNIPQNGEIIRTKVCMKGPSNLFVELSNSTSDPTYRLNGIIGGWGNTKSAYILNGQSCGQEQLRPPILDLDWWTCAYLILNHHVADNKGTVFLETRGLEPVMISCTSIDDPDQLQFIRFGTNAEEVYSALILYDCPIDLKTICRGDVNLDVAVDVNQSQSANVGNVV